MRAVIDYPITRGTLNRPASTAASGALRSSSLSRQRRPRHIVAIDRAIDDLRGRRDAGGVERANLFDVGEDVAELPGKQIELVVRQLEPREFRDPLHILPAQ